MLIANIKLEKINSEITEFWIILSIYYSHELFQVIAIQTFLWNQDNKLLCLLSKLACYIFQCQIFPEEGKKKEDNLGQQY